MSEVFYAVCYGMMLTVIIAAIEFFRIILNKKKFDNLDYFLVALALFNGLGYAFVVWGTKKGLNNAIWTNRIERYDATSISIYFLLNIVLLIAVISGWTIVGKIGKKASGIKYDYNLNLNEKLYFTLTITAWLLFVLALGSYVLYARAYGGFSGLLYYSKAIRSSLITINNPFSFLQRFGAFSFFSSFLFFSMLIDKNLEMKKRRNAIAGFITSFCFSVFVLYSWEGRVAFIAYILTFLLGIILYKNKSIIKLAKKMAIVFILGLILIVTFDRLLDRSPIGISAASLFVIELSFPSAAFITRLGNDSYRWFKDILIAPLYLLPSRIWRYKLGFDTASMLITYDFWGAYKGEAGITGSIPVDLLTFSYMQAHLAGVVIVGLLTGASLLTLQRLQDSIPIESVRAIISSNIILNVIILTVPYGEPYHILTRCFYLIGGLIVLFIIFSGFKEKIKE